MSTENFPKFYFESNQCWRFVESKDDLLNHVNLTALGLNKTFSEALNYVLGARRHRNGHNSFGTCSEYSDSYRLGSYLRDNKIDIESVSE